MTELPPDVRDRAARAAVDIYHHYPQEPFVWAAVVAAVAEVLAADRFESECTCTKGLDYEGPCSWCDVHGQPSVAHRQGVDAGYQEAKFSYELDMAASTRGIQEARADRDALKARVDLLSTENEETHRGWDNALTALRMENEVRVHAQDQVIELRARVDLLTTALTALVEHWDDEGPHATGEAAAEAARAVLAATPTTEPVPLKASQIPTEPGVPSMRVSPGSRSYWAAIRQAENTPTEGEGT
jgi:hypothetical protein